MEKYLEGFTFIFFLSLTNVLIFLKQNDSVLWYLRCALGQQNLILKSFESLTPEFALKLPLNIYFETKENLKISFTILPKSAKL